jgi:hypothetical protein
MHISGLTDDSLTLYSMEKAEQSTHYESFLTRFKINIMMHDDVREINRSVLNMFIVLSDVGGLYGILVSSFSTILLIFNY